MLKNSKMDQSMDEESNYPRNVIYRESNWIIGEEVNSQEASRELKFSRLHSKNKHA
jgi:hypothetical protein